MEKEPTEDLKKAIKKLPSVEVVTNRPAVDQPDRSTVEILPKRGTEPLTIIDRNSKT